MKNIIKFLIDERFIGLLSIVIAFISVVLMYKSSRPKIKINVKSCCDFSISKKYTAVLIELYNTSSVIETISDITAKTKNGLYHCRASTDLKDINSLMIYNQINNIVDSEKTKLSVPIILPPFSYTFGVILFFECVPTRGETVVLNFQRVSVYKRRLKKTTVANEILEDEV